MTHDELLQRIAGTLKKEIGPAIEAEYPKTQAFMAAVVAQKLGRQVGLARTHESAEVADIESLLVDLRAIVQATAVPARVLDAINILDNARTKRDLCMVIDALYLERGELGETSFTALLNRVRKTLRASIDRQMEYAA
jgi:hypothetical protein